MSPKKGQRVKNNDAQSSTTVDAIITRLKNNRVIAIFIVIGIILGAIAGFSDTVKKLIDLLPQSPYELAIRGTIVPEVGTSPAKNLKVGLLWGIEDDLVFYGVGNVKPTDKSEILQYEILFSSQPPPDAMLMREENGFPFGDAKLGVALIIAFDDINDNNIFDGDIDVILAISPDYALTYLSGTLPNNINGEQLWTLQKLKQGYSLTKAVHPAEHGMPTDFDDLVPVDSSTSVDLVLPKDRSHLHGPNWT